MKLARKQTLRVKAETRKARKAHHVYEAKQALTTKK
jgi:hypothetical protein